MITRSGALAILVMAFVVDLVIPLPLVAAVLLVVAFTRPPWFLELVRAVYDERG